MNSTPGVIRVISSDEAITYSSGRVNVNPAVKKNPATRPIGCNIFGYDALCDSRVRIAGAINTCASVSTIFGYSAVCDKRRSIFAINT